MKRTPSAAEGAKLGRDEVKRRPTITDLAEKAGVSVATVDRVLNKRHTVREITVRRVLNAAEELGYHATGLLQRRLQEQVPERTLAFLLQKRTDHFYQTLGADLATATRKASDIRGKPIVEFIDELSPAAVVEAMRTVGDKADAIAVVAVDHPHITEEIGRLHARGVPVFTLLSDLSAPLRAGYIGLDSRKAGRSAAWTIARLAKQPGKVGIVVGSHRYLGQELAEISFRSYFRELAPEFQLLEPLINLEDVRIAYDATLDMLKRNPDMVGFYAAGGGVEGIIRALREKPSGDHIVFVCNEIDPNTRAGLIDGVVDMVLATPTALLAEKAVEAMAKAAAAPAPLQESAAQIVLPLGLFISENI
jgi:LacI family transcriptional regulator